MPYRTIAADERASNLARDLALKALETQKIVFTAGSHPTAVGNAVGELYNAILEKISVDRDQGR